MEKAADRARPDWCERIVREYVRSRFKPSMDWITRPVFGVLLAVAAVTATIAGGLIFIAFLTAGCVAAAREWHRMFTRKALWPHVLLTTVALAACLLSQWTLRGVKGPGAVLPYIFLWAGSMLQLPLAFWRNESLLAHAWGVLYVGLAALSLLLLRFYSVHPLWLVLMLFVAIWATDTGAFVLGRLIGGPKLAPVWSPNKTWAGFAGGLICGTASAVLVAHFANGRVLSPLGFGAIIAIVAQMGDLFESYVKRRIGVKDSGGLIPGHGGMLDRIDSSLVAAPVAAILVLGCGLDPLIGFGP